MAAVVAGQPYRAILSSPHQAIANAYERLLPMWFDLENRNHRMIADCCALNEQYERKEIDIERLRTELKQVITPQFFSMQEAMRKVASLYFDCDRLLPEQGSILLCQQERDLFKRALYRHDWATLDRKFEELTDISINLARKVQHFVTTRVDFSWYLAQKVFEKNLTSAEVSLGWIGTIRGYLPTVLTGFPRVEKVFGEYAQEHAADLPVPVAIADLPSAQPLGCSDPITYQEEIAAVDAVTQKINRLLLEIDNQPLPVEPYETRHLTRPETFGVDELRRLPVFGGAADANVVIFCHRSLRRMKGLVHEEQRERLKEEIGALLQQQLLLLQLLRQEALLRQRILQSNLIYSGRYLA